MKSVARALLILGVPLCLSDCAAPGHPAGQAQQSPAAAPQAAGVRSVEAIGLGENVQRAKEDAIRNAVQQVVGTYVSSEQVMKNRALIKDQVLNYSAGYVEKLDVLSEERRHDSLYAVRIRADVVSSRLRRKLDELHVPTGQIAGESVFAEALSKNAERQDGERLLNSTLAKFPTQALRASVGKAVVVDQNAQYATLSVPVSLNWDADYVAELRSAVMVTRLGDCPATACNADAVILPKSMLTSERIYLDANRAHIVHDRFFAYLMLILQVLDASGVELGVAAWNVDANMVNAWKSNGDPRLEYVSLNSVWLDPRRRATCEVRFSIQLSGLQLARKLQVIMVHSHESVHALREHALPVPAGLTECRTS